MEGNTGSSLTSLQDQISDLTRERDGLQRLLTFTRSESASLEQRYEQDLIAARGQRDEARRELSAKCLEMERIGKDRIAEHERAMKERIEHLEASFAAEKAEWQKEKAAMQGELEVFRASVHGVSADELSTLLGELDKAVEENRNLQNRMQTIRAATTTNPASQTLSNAQTPTSHGLLKQELDDRVSE